MIVVLIKNKRIKKRAVQNGSLMTFNNNVNTMLINE